MLRYTLVLTCAACGAGGVRLDSTHDVALAEKLAAFQAALNDAGGCEWAGIEGARTITVVVRRADSPFLGLYDSMGEGLVLISEGLSDETFTRTLAHELGHAYGFGHSDDPCSLMYRQRQCALSGDEAIAQLVALIQPCGVSVP